MRNLTEALGAYRGSRPPLAAPPINATGDQSADEMLAAYFGKLVKVDNHRRRVADLERWITQQEAIGEEFHFAERAGRSDPDARRSHALILGALMTWLRELRGIDLDMLGQDIIEGRVTA
ncbi:hypothetical protein SAMN02745157_4828 [Kaistia soli DSM 19436]|uniref:Uncharacterized protein n=1 Tax=Kaistia soli DSM 19436 TaxID=1122133 RepID=A0A1M5MMT1_9HYPH|nr:hypothetical protein [Kaistia soli]SHG78608.1 hypothetical protein SAMN02745157_4828 [Kaistia soli DSM 19436]